MPRKLENFLKCVYIIRFKNYHKVYIGSSVKWPYRKREHLYKLSKNRCHNPYLQRAYNKYGKENVVIEELEFCDNYTTLLKCEQKWIDFFQAANPKYGFNLVSFVETNGTTGYKLTEKQRQKLIGNNAKTYYLYNPKGERIKVHNLKRFCKDNNLNYNRTIKVIHGSVVECCGWKSDLKRVNQRKKVFKFISPEGHPIEIYGLRAFCKENHLDYKTMLAVHAELCKTCQKWKKYNPIKNIIYYNKGKTWNLRTPKGKIIIINNLVKFCQDNQINHDSLRKLGKRKQGYKGWKILS